jgi:hypothetical protein
MVTIFFKLPILVGNQNKQKGVCDAPLNSLKDSNVNLKVKRMEEGVGACPLIHNTSGVRRAC